jgi:hypothetical protein
MWPLLLLSLVVRAVTTSCPHTDHRFHGAVELAWAEDAWRSELPPEHLEGLQDYCHCKGAKHPTDFCRSVFAAYFAKPRAVQESSHPGLQAKKAVWGDSGGVVALQQGAAVLVHRFLSQVTKKLMVDNVLVVLDEQAALTALFTFVKEVLEEKVRVTVHLAGGGRNLTQAALHSGSQPVAVFILGQTATSLAKQLFTCTSLFLHTRFHWVVETTSLEDIKAGMEGVDLPIYSNVLAFNGSFSDVLTLWEVYRPAPGLPLRPGLWGVWAAAGLVVLAGEKWERRADLTGVARSPPPRHDHYGFPQVDR